MEVICQFRIDKLLSFKAKGALLDLQKRYLKRVKEDDKNADGAVSFEFSRPVVEFESWQNDALCAVTDEGGEPLKRVKVLPVFFEMRHLFRIAFEKPFPKSVEIDHPMAAIADGFQYEDGVLWGDIDFVNSPGVFSLKLKIVHWNNQDEEIEFKFPVVSVKMNVARDYAAIKDDIQKASPGLVLAFLAKTFDDAGFDGARSGKKNDEQWFGILQDVFSSYEVACKKIIHDPHRRYQVEPTWLRADRIRRWTPQQANAFARCDAATQEVARFRSMRIVAEKDTVENRFVLHTLRSLKDDMLDFAGRFCEQAGVSSNFIDNIRKRANDLGRLATDPFFNGVGPFEGFRQQSLVLQRKPGYAQVLAVWLQLKQALSPAKRGIQVGYRPISSLYEFWCFLEFKKLLSKELGIEGEDKVEKGTIDNVLEKEDLKDGTKEKTLSKLIHVWKKGGRTYTLSYQKTYGLEGEDRTFAIDYLQRPDLVLTIQGDDDADDFTYLFDSKYRVSTMDGKDASPRDAIDEMHRYRDAILYRRSDGRLHHVNREAIGAYVIFPGRSGDKSYEYKDKRKIENIGAIPLLPGEDGEKSLATFIAEIVAKRTDPEEHLSADIPTRGTSVVVGEAFGESMILEVEQPAESFLEKVRKHFVFPVEKSKVDVTKHYRQIKYVIPNQSVGLFNIDQSVPAKEMTGDAVPHFGLSTSMTYVVYTLEAKKEPIAGVTPSPVV